MRLASIAVVAVLLSSPVLAADDRQVVELGDDGRAFVLSEMRTLLEAVQGITQGLADGDLKAVEAAATPVGRKMMREGSPMAAEAMGKMPMDHDTQHQKHMAEMMAGNMPGGPDGRMEIMRKMPADFRQMAFGMHQAFDEIAAGAVQGETTEMLLDKVSGLLARCTSCHAAFQLK